MERLNISKIHVGICFSEPVFFEDGKNMFLPAGKQAKQYHVAALEQWKIPYLLTAGHEIDPKDYVPPAPAKNAVLKDKAFDDIDIEEFDSVDDLEEI